MPYTSYGTRSVPTTFEKWHIGKLFLARSLASGRVDYLAHRHNQGALTPDEQAEYGKVVSFGTFIAILKSKARQLLAASAGE